MTPRLRVAGLALLTVLGVAPPQPALAAPTASKTSAKPKAASSPRTSRPSSGGTKARKTAGKASATALKKLAPSAATKHSAKALQSAVPRGAALVAAALLNYADGDRKSAVDRKIAKALDRLPGAQATAKRIAARIRAQPAAVRNGIVGGHAKSLEGPTSTRSIASNTRGAWSAGFSDGLGPLLPVAITLPPEDVGVPNMVELTLAGVHCEQADDGDGGDELVVLSKLAKTYSNPAIEYMHEDGTAAPVEVTPGQTRRIGATRSLAKNEQVLLVSAVAEADQDADIVREELELAIELARQLAVDTGGTDPFGTFVATLAYTEGMLNLSAPDRAPSLRAQRVKGTDLASWWSADAETTGEIEWKVQVHHATGSGRYTVLYDVPSEIPPLTEVSVLVHRVRAVGSDGVGEDYAMHVETSIDGATAPAVPMPAGVSDGNPFSRVRRRVQPGTVLIQIAVERVPLWEAWRSKKTGQRYYCGSPPPGKAHGQNVGSCENRGIEMDASPSAPPKVLSLSYDPETNALSDGTGVLRPLQGGRYELAGNDAYTAVELTLSVSDEGP